MQLHCNLVRVAAAPRGSRGAAARRGRTARAADRAIDPAVLRPSTGMRLCHACHARYVLN